MSRCANRACHIRANAYSAATEGQKSAFTASAATRRILWVVGIEASSPDIVERLETQESNWKSSLDERYGSCGLEQANKTSVGWVWFPGVDAVPDTDIEAADRYAVLQAHRDTSQRALEIDRTILQPAFCFLDHDFGDTVRFGMRERRSLAVGAQHIDCWLSFLLNILDQSVYGLIQDYFIIVGDWAMVWRRQARKAGSTVRLLALAMWERDMSAR